MNRRYATFAARKIGILLERQIDARLHLLAGERQLDEELVEHLICDDTAIANWLKDQQATQIIARLVADGELIAIEDADHSGQWSVKPAKNPCTKSDGVLRTATRARRPRAE
jgi:hypothetical protein